MNSRTSKREVWVGLVVVAALAGLLGMLSMATDGPGVFAARRTIDVVFRDGQGIRPGSAVRIAGIDSGRVTDVDLTEYEGAYRARVKIALPARLADKLRQDVKITIQATLTGQSRVNIVSSGRSAVALTPNRVVQGVESTFFDPILEQVGLGPVERSHLSHTIAEVRTAVDAAAPKVQQIVASLQETAAGIKDSSEHVRPAIEATAGHIEDLAKRVSDAGPRIGGTIQKVESLTAQADQLVTENRPNLRATLASLRDLSATAQDAAAKNRPKVEQLLANVDQTRARADRTLYQADVIASQLAQMLTRNRANMERTVANVKDATDWANKLVQKIFANPFVLSPFYKPTPEDTRVQVVYDTAQVFTKGAQELNDMVKTLDALKARAQSPADQEEIARLERGIQEVTDRLGTTSSLLAEALKKPQPTARRR